MPWPDHQLIRYFSPHVGLAIQNCIRHNLSMKKCFKRLPNADGTHLWCMADGYDSGPPGAIEQQRVIRLAPHKQHKSKGSSSAAAAPHKKRSQAQAHAPAAAPTTEAQAEGTGSHATSTSRRTPRSTSPATDPATSKMGFNAGDAESRSNTSLQAPHTKYKLGNLLDAAETASIKQTTVPSKSARGAGTAVAATDVVWAEGGGKIQVRHASQGAHGTEAEDKVAAAAAALKAAMPAGAHSFQDDSAPPPAPSTPATDMDADVDDAAPAAAKAAGRGGATSEGAAAADDGEEDTDATELVLA